MYSVEFAYNIVPSDEAGQGLSNLLIRQLAAIESGKGLQQAARSLGVSYRYFWGQIEIWEERFGQKLVIREQGKRATLAAWPEASLGGANRYGELRRSNGEDADRAQRCFCRSLQP